MRAERRGALVFVGVLVFSAVLGSIYGPPVRATAAGTSDLQDSIKNLTRVLTVVQQNYAIPVDTDHAIYAGAIPGMLRVLDPHSSFFDPREYANLREDQRGKILRRRHDDRAARIIITYVLAPMPGSPAFERAFAPATSSRRGWKIHGWADQFRSRRHAERPQGHGRAHHDEARWLRPNDLTFTVTRDEIPKHSVDLDFVVKPGIGYIKLSGFNETTDTELAAALKQIGRHATRMDWSWTCAEIPAAC